MAYAYRAKTRLCPVLATQYTQNPRVDTTTVCYLPGYRWARTECSYVPEQEPFTFTVVGPTGTRTYSGTATPGTPISAHWSLFATSVFELFGNDPIIYGTLNGLQSNDTGLYYPFGTAIPSRSGTFTPFVSFT